jgi:hypothetical protein
VAGRVAGGGGRGGGRAVAVAAAAGAVFHAPLALLLALLLGACAAPQRPNDALDLAPLVYSRGTGCDIARVDGRKLTKKAFLQEYASQPLLITDAWRADGGGFLHHVQSTARACRAEDHAGGFRHRVGEFQKRYPETSVMNFDGVQPELRAFFERRTHLPKWFRRDPLSQCRTSDVELSFEWRWLLIGGKGGGSAWHFDPLNTSAWNALTAGGPKRWSMYHPSVVTKEMAGVIAQQGAHLPAEERFVLFTDSYSASKHSALQWVREVEPQLVPSARPLTCMQHPGDIVYIPSGWWHMVLNIDDNIAWTQNLVQPTAADVAASTRSMRSYVAHRQAPAKVRGQMVACAQKLEAAWGVNATSSTPPTCQGGDSAVGGCAA